MQRREPKRAEGDRVAAPNGIVIDAASRQLRSLCSELSNATHAPPLRFLLLYELYSPHLEAYFPRFLAPSIIIIIIKREEARSRISLFFWKHSVSLFVNVQLLVLASSPNRVLFLLVSFSRCLLWIFHRQGCFSESLFSRVSHSSFRSSTRAIALFRIARAQRCLPLERSTFNLARFHLDRGQFSLGVSYSRKRNVNRNRVLQFSVFLSYFLKP